MKHKRRIPISYKILMPVMALIIIETVLLVAIPFGAGTLSYMKENEKAVFQEKVLNRKNYLENEMLTRWARVDETAKRINDEAQNLLDKGEISLETLDAGSAEGMPLLEAAYQNLITMMRMNQVTGAFIVLNTDDLQALSEQGIYLKKPGIYLRDYDPQARAWEDNRDILLEYAPAQIAQRQGISLNSGWKPQFDFSCGQEYADYLFMPWQAALETENRTELDPSQMGYWGMQEEGCSSARVLTYSVPLVLKDGTVYGVLGVDLTEDYLQKRIPCRELADGKGSYVLAVQPGEGSAFEEAAATGAAWYPDKADESGLILEEEKGSLFVKNDSGESLYCDVKYLELYDGNSPFSNEKWAILGIVDSTSLFQFSDRVIQMALQLTGMTLAVGVLGGILVSFLVSRPIARVAKNVRQADLGGEMKIDRTGILEMDMLAETLEHQSYEIVHTMNKFSNVINLAEMKMAVFEISDRDRTVFVTDQFFELFGIPRQDQSGMKPEDFREIMDGLERYRRDENAGKGEAIYQIPSGEGKCRYIRLRKRRDEMSWLGVAEDVTEHILEHQKIVYERDHDPLTGLMNRRAFLDQGQELFSEKAQQLRTAAMMMIDLDELKRVNDTFGHAYGDRYIRCAAEGFLEAGTDRTLICRLAGDEFCIFFYDGQDRDEIRRKMDRIRKKLAESAIKLPDHQMFPIRLSAGIAWYPEDADSFEGLMGCADFAMYQIKHSGKNSFREFAGRQEQETQEAGGFLNASASESDRYTF